MGTLTIQLIAVSKPALLDSRAVMKETARTASQTTSTLTIQLIAVSKPALLDSRAVMKETARTARQTTSTLTIQLIAVSKVVLTAPLQMMTLATATLHNLNLFEYS